MFEHRLGLALGKTLKEIRAMPYPEFRSWQLFGILEPFGFRDNEYRTAAILAMLHNVNHKKPKKVSVFMRDIEKAVLEELKEKPDVSTLSRDEIIRLIERDFGL